MTYLIDSDVFIEAKNRHYGFEFCPAFWEWLEANNARGLVFSVEKIGAELKAGHDQLADWAVARGTAFFLPADAGFNSAMATVASWAAGSGYHQVAIDQFLSTGDSHLVAHALAHGHIVVTHEQP